MTSPGANGQPGFALYMRGDDGDWHAFQLQVVTLTAAGISHVTAFFDLGLFATFGLPMTMPMTTPAHGQAVLAPASP